MAAPALLPSFDRFGPAAPESPIIVSVPHAGRDYPAAMAPLLRVPVSALAPLEDRYIDAVAHAAHGDEALFVQHCPRAWIDLNRAERDRDPLLDRGAEPAAQRALSAKVRGGLGLVPRRLATVGELWRAPLGAAEVEARITRDYRPYHAAITGALAAARARYGIAVLVDLHSMPGLGAADEVAQIVIGDRFGHSAAARLVASVEAVIEAAGLRQALNSPYAGGHILERHADPPRHIHAIQIEVDRRLYLDAAGDRPGAGLAATAALLRAMLAALRATALDWPLAEAAE